jgi:hypothetical protein
MSSAGRAAARSAAVQSSSPRCCRINLYRVKAARFARRRAGLACRSAPGGPAPRAAPDDPWSPKAVAIATINVGAARAGRTGRPR